MTSPPLDSTHGRQRRAWHDIAAFGQHARLDDVGHDMPSIAFGQHTRSNDVGCGMPSLPLDGKYGQTTSGMACHHRLWAAQMVERRRAWHAIIALGRQTRSNYVRRDMPSPPFDSMHDRTTSGIACVLTGVTPTRETAINMEIVAIW